MLYLANDNQIVGAMALEDEIRPEARQAVADLREMGVDVAMITGDARQVAEAVGLDLASTTCSPKYYPKTRTKPSPHSNDKARPLPWSATASTTPPPLPAPTSDWPIGACTDVATESAGVVLASSDPRGVASVIRLSRASYRKMIQNLAWTAGYNVVAIPLASGAFACAGVTLSPAVGAVLMSLSTIVVALNAQVLRRVQLKQPVG